MKQNFRKIFMDRFLLYVKINWHRNIQGIASRDWRNSNNKIFKNWLNDHRRLKYKDANIYGKLINSSKSRKLSMELHGEDFIFSTATHSTQWPCCTKLLITTFQRLIYILLKKDLPRVVFSIQRKVSNWNDQKYTEKAGLLRNQILKTNNTLGDQRPQQIKNLKE